MEDKDFFESVSRLLRQAPAPVRDFVLNELPQATERLMQRHQLHIDQGGVLESELLLLLLGQSTPEEFVMSLKEGGVPEEKLKALVGDVNTEIFMRIRKQEQTQKPPEPRPTPPVPPSAPAARTPVPIYSPLPSAPIQILPPPHVMQALEKPQAPKQVAPPANLPGQVPPTPPPRPAPPPPPHIEMPVPPPPPPREVPHTDAQSRVIHTMSRDMQALKSGVDPLRVAHPVPPGWAEAPNATPLAPPRPIPPPSAPPPQPLPPPMPAHEAPVPPPIIEKPHPQQAL
ncbi:MAG TPA: hypothetical protein VEA36_03225, partial [Candidatus Paceibacterota bacterium]|nr:hypothetical protein [Candidatus Paceibacterota bacterium]